MAVRFLCCGAGVRFWHDSDIQECPPNVGYRGQSGQHLLNLSFTAFDPSATSARKFAVMHNAAFPAGVW
jgi:hypothetical protein